MKRDGFLTAILVLASTGVAHTQEILIEPGITNWASPLYWTPPQKLAKEVASETAAEPMGVEAVPTNTLPFVGVTPCRIVDTRGNGFAGDYGPPALTAGVPRNFTLTGQCGIPGNAEAVSLNVTVTNTLGPGHIVIFPQGGGQPTASTLNYVAGQTIANAAVVPLGAGGGITVVAGVSGTDLIIDTNGYYGPSLDSICVNEGQMSSITSAMITDGAIVDADINASAAIADTKLATITTADKVADSALSANVSKLGPTIEPSEISNEVRTIQIPLTSFVDCTNGAPIDFTSGVDARPDFLVAGETFQIFFDATAGSEDQNTEICSQIYLPADYFSEGQIRVIAVKAASSGALETLRCEFARNNDFSSPHGLSLTTVGVTSVVCSPTLPAGLTPTQTIRIYLSITSGGIINDGVGLISVAFQYRATH